VSVRRVYGAGIVLGVALTVAVWLFTYRVSDVAEHIFYSGGKRHVFHPPTHLSVQPWWAAPASIGVLLVGGAISVWLLPGSQGLVRRLAQHFAALSGRRLGGRASDLAK